MTTAGSVGGTGNLGTISKSQNCGTILTLRTALLTDFKGGENEMTGAFDPKVEETTAGNVPRFPAAIMDPCAFKIPHLISESLIWLTCGVVMGKIVIWRGVIDEIVTGSAGGAKLMVILYVESLKACMLEEVGVNPSAKLSAKVTVAGSKYQTEPVKVITSAWGAYWPKMIAEGETVILIVTCAIIVGTESSTEGVWSRLIWDEMASS